ncbi:MAG: flavin-containing monooxygenase [Bacteriovoracia bacterium]
MKRIAIILFFVSSLSSFANQYDNSKAYQAVPVRTDLFPNPESDRYLIVGAGPAGLAFARIFQANGIPFDIVEAESGVGGIWYPDACVTSVYPNVTMNSSKTMSQYDGYDMPEEFPDYLSSRQAWEYLDSFARHYGIKEKVKFDSRVTVLHPDSQGERWTAGIRHLDQLEVKSYLGAVIASGFQRIPNFPEAYQQWDSNQAERLSFVHAMHLKNLEDFKDKVVVVWGGGNTGFDIATQLSKVAKKVYLSLRRGYWLVPEYIFGQPADAFAGDGPKLPHWFEKIAFRALVWWYIGSFEKLGLPKPDHDLLEMLPVTARQDTIDALKARRIIAISNISEISGDTLILSDGSTISDVDQGVIATGYKHLVPYIEESSAKEALNLHDDGPDFYLHLFHPNPAQIPALNNIFLSGGYLETLAGGWPTYDHQAKAAAAYILAKAQGKRSAEFFDKEKASGVSPDLKGHVFKADQHRNRYGVDFQIYHQVLDEKTEELSQ